MLLPAKCAANIQGTWCTNDSNLKKQRNFRQTEMAQEEEQPQTSMAEAQRQKAQAWQCYINAFHEPPMVF